MEQRKLLNCNNILPKKLFAGAGMNSWHFIAIIFVVFFNCSCEKTYTCICISKYSNQDTIVDQVKTTNLGSKGFGKTCTGYEASNPNLKSCSLR